MEFTLVGSTILEGRMEIHRFPDLPDTPDGFGSASPVSFGSAESVRFTPEGTLVDQDGDIVNGTVLLGVPADPLTARAITIFGATALINEWRWNGSAWVE